VVQLESVKELVKDRTVSFCYYRDGELWYRVDPVGEEVPFFFPVATSDTGTAMFKATDRAILFMRYIRKQHEFLESIYAQDEKE